VEKGMRLNEPDKPPNVLCSLVLYCIDNISDGGVMPDFSIRDPDNQLGQTNQFWPRDILVNPALCSILLVFIKSVEGKKI
jgi:hypothetical protein